MKNQRLLMGLILGFLITFLSYPNEVPAQADPFYKGKTHSGSQVWTGLGSVRFGVRSDKSGSWHDLFAWSSPVRFTI
jgi:hypothetical protein